MQYLPVTNKMFGCCWSASLLSYWWYQFFSGKCFLPKANLSNTTTSLCVAVQIRKKEHLPSPRGTNNFTLTYEQLIKLNRKLGFINEWCTKWQPGLRKFSTSSELTNGITDLVHQIYFLVHKECWPSIHSILICLRFQVHHWM